jgi:hypothetical protein
MSILTSEHRCGLGIGLPMETVLEKSHLGLAWHCMAFWGCKTGQDRNGHFHGMEDANLAIFRFSGNLGIDLLLYLPAFILQPVR